MMHRNESEKHQPQVHHAGRIGFQEINNWSKEQPKAKKKGKKKPPSRYLKITFFLRHSSHARETLDRFRGAVAVPERLS
jgi:hypothetical protein